MASAKAPGSASPSAAVKLAAFDSPLATSVNNAACLLGLTVVALDLALLIADLLERGGLVGYAFLLTFAPMFPLAAWATVVQNALRSRERARLGLPLRRRSPSPFSRTSPFADLPPGFLRTRDKVALGVFFAIGIASFFGARWGGADSPTLPFLGVPLALTVAATVMSLAERRRRAALHLGGVLGWPSPPVPAPRLARSRALLVWLLVAGPALGGIGGLVTVVQLDAYGVTRLASHGTSIVSLPRGDDVIFVGYLGESAAAPFDPAQVTVIELRTGSRVKVRWDLSADHNSPDAIPSLGLVAFDAPRDGRYRMTVDGPRGLHLFVGRSPGAEARFLVPWIALLALGMALTAVGLVGLVVRLSWRYRVVRRAPSTPPRTIEAWMAQDHVP